MNKLKIFILIVFATFLSPPVSAVTMNGCDTTAMQGCSASATVFDPLSGSPLKWFDARDTDSVTVTGLGISTWTDKGSQGDDISQGTDANRPPYTSGVSVDFDATTDYLGTVFSSAVTQPVTIIIAMKWNGSDRDRIWDRGLVFDPFRSGSDNTSIHGGSWLDGGVSMPTTKTVFSMVYNGVSSSITIDGGTATASGNSGSNTMTGFLLGADTAFQASFFANMNVYEIFVFNRVLTSAEHNQYGKYLERHGTTWTDIP